MKNVETTEKGRWFCLEASLVSTAMKERKTSEVRLLSCVHLTEAGVKGIVPFLPAHHTLH